MCLQHLSSTPWEHILSFDSHKGVPVISILIRQSMRASFSRLPFHISDRLQWAICLAFINRRILEGKVHDGITACGGKVRTQRCCYVSQVPTPSYAVLAFVCSPAQVLAPASALPSFCVVESRSLLACAQRYRPWYGDVTTSARYLSTGVFLLGSPLVYYRPLVPYPALSQVQQHGQKDGTCESRKHNKLCPSGVNLFIKLSVTGTKIK